MCGPAGPLLPTSNLHARSSGEDPWPEIEPKRGGRHHARSRHRRHRAHPDRAGQQGLAGGVPARRPRPPSSSRPCWPRCRSSTRPTVEDVILGCGQPAGEPGYNVARVAASSPACPTCPGVTVNRYCSSSLQTIRMAAHAIKAGEGDVFVAGRRRDGQPLPARRVRHAARTTPPFADAEARTTARTPAVTEPWTPPAGLPDVYIAMGQTAENVAESEKVSRQEMDEFALAVAEAGGRVPAERLLRAGDHPGDRSPTAPRSRKDDGPRPTRRSRDSPSCSRSFREGGTVTAGNACPLNDGRGGGHRHERHQGQGARHHAAGADRGQRGVGSQPRDHGPRPGRGLPPGAGAGRA